MNIIRGKKARAQRVLVYGQEGVGKTTLVSKLPSVLILDTESGADNVACDHAAVCCVEDLRAAFRELLDERKAGACAYKVVALDTADRVWAMCAEEVCRANKLKSIEDMPYGKGMKMATEQFVRVVTGGMEALANAGLHVVVCAHSKVERISPPDNVEYTQYQVKVSAPGKQAEEAAAALKQWADAVLFCHFRTAVNAVTGKALSEERVVATTHSAQWEAKNRFGLKEELPMEAKELSMLFPELGEAPAAPAAPEGTCPAQGAVRSEAAQPEPEAALPEELRGHEEELCAFLVSKGQLKPGQGVADIGGAMMARILRNPGGVLKAIVNL